MKWGVGGKQSERKKGSKSIHLIIFTKINTGQTNRYKRSRVRAWAETVRKGLSRYTFPTSVAFES